MNRAVRAAVGWFIFSTALWCASAHGQATPKDGDPAVVLDTLSVWRIHETLRPPVIQLDDGLLPITSTYQWLDRETAAPPADWTAPEFPDGNWLRGGARATSRTPYLADLCLRARFEVTDPAQVKDLKLSLTYYGGAIVYVNGQELVRGHVAKEARPVLAEGYPPRPSLPRTARCCRPPIGRCPGTPRPWLPGRGPWRTCRSRPSCCARASTCWPSRSSARPTTRSSTRRRTRPPTNASWPPAIAPTTSPGTPARSGRSS